MHRYVFSCTPSHAPLCTLMHPSRAPLVLMHHSYSCTTCSCAPLHTRALLHNLVHYLCTAMYSHAPLVLVQQSRAPLLLVHHSRAPLILVHHSALVHCSVISCTTHALLRTLVHLSRVPLMHHSVISCTTQVLSCTTLVHHSRSNALSALLTYSRTTLNHS